MIFLENHDIISNLDSLFHKKIFSYITNAPLTIKHNLMLAWDLLFTHTTSLPSWTFLTSFCYLLRYRDNILIFNTTVDFSPSELLQIIMDQYNITFTLENSVGRGGDLQSCGMK